MPSWNELLVEAESRSAQAAAQWLTAQQSTALRSVSNRRSGRNVIFYASAFLQKPTLPGYALSLTHEEINGFMTVMFKMDWTKGLTLILHTPGGSTNAVETLVSYLLTKFDGFEVIVPTFAMSAGTMISLASDRIIMGRQSQLGPIDPQMPAGDLYVSARAIVDQFEQAKADIMENVETAHVWAPILHRVGPALLKEAQNALDYAERMVACFLAQRMFREFPDSNTKAENTAKFFNDAVTHKSHGRRSDREEARRHGVVVDDLENDQELQDDVLTAYHLTTILFEKGPASKILSSHVGRYWIKNFSA